MRPVTLWGVYHANGGLVGELAYVIGKLRGTAHCGLCDITHGSVRVKPKWKTLEASLGIPFRLVHLNEQPLRLAALTQGSTPCVVGESEEEGSSLIDPVLRDRRCEAMKDLIQALQQPMARRVRQIGHAMEMRERRRRKRHPLWGEIDLVADRQSIMPEAEALGREAAERVTRRAGKELSPAAMGAIRRYLLDPSSGPACDAAIDAGISPATMTRALKRLRSISAEELKGCREAILKPFSAALLDRLRAA